MSWAALTSALSPPGGGLVNLDTYCRACHLPDVQVIRLLGEGSFHQVHGGIATNRSDAPRDAFNAEYEALVGHPFTYPQMMTWFFGTLHPAAMRSVPRLSPCAGGLHRRGVATAIDQCWSVNISSFPRRRGSARESAENS